jgi:hypothetical protein
VGVGVGDGVEDGMDAGLSWIYGSELVLLLD